ncbi:putative leucine-rich repeat receptor-like protein kinase At2g19210 isoform X2 [Nymphaea colorata]|nr:putative leucine-rich repeat receptor-like protein kinase At2g19210 isoform X2 [Nymphaea colorata]
MYGNYEGGSSNATAIFDLYLGVDFWETIKLDNATHMHWTEFSSHAMTTSMSVCLVETTGYVPFISALELRPLNDGIIYLVNASIALSTLMRIDVGATREIRYPDDPHDRIWTPDKGSYGTPISTTQTVNEDRNRRFGLPSAVMQTAATTNSSPILITWPREPDARYYFVADFAELLSITGKRNITVKLNDANFVNPLTPDYLNSLAVFSTNPMNYPRYSFSIGVTSDSDYGPILNAFEVFKVIEPSQSATLSGDVDAIKAIKTFYGVKKNWKADPCLPQNSPWDGLNCSYDNTSAARIVSLDLSNSGLRGAVSNLLSQLTKIQKLNLARNNLDGPIPSFLQELPYLTNLDLSCNCLSGSLPSKLQERADSGQLTLSIDSNAQICGQVPCEQGRKSVKKRNIIIAVAVATTLVVFMSLSSAFIMMKKKRKPRDDSPIPQNKRVEGRGRTFSYAEIAHITNDFQKAIGKGGYGSVYYGLLRDGKEVAVKTMTRSLPQGIKEYTAEVELLMKVHHKYLASFVGFCDEDEKLILVYEYMERGNLRELLSEETYTPDWKQRLQIALNVAAALEYLHSGCRPPIVHRDVKTTNILLDSNLEAKLADFGLSKTGIKDDITHMSTAVAGTPGYIDPEYYNTSKLTEKSDVYSFGVVLFELITGRHAIFTLGSNRVHILQWVTPKIVRGEIASIVDPRLQGSYDTVSMWKVADTALSCTADKAIARPTMTEVVNELMEAMNIETHRVKRSPSSGSMPRSVSLSGGADLNLDSIVYPSAR